MNQQLFIGLGNPGEEYARTYHNVGALAVTFLADTAPEKESALFSYKKNGGVIFIIPHTYMNESGTTVKKALSFFNLDTRDIVLFHDESDLEIGEYKISDGGGSAGHKGVASVIEAVGTPEFIRVRIGIRPQSSGPRKKAEEFVLDPISSRDQTILDKVFYELREKLIENVTP